MAALFYPVVLGTIFCGVGPVLGNPFPSLEDFSGESEEGFPVTSIEEDEVALDPRLRFAYGKRSSEEGAEMTIPERE